jgi:D-alanyl-D-alanine carboxypeptidase
MTDHGEPIAFSILTNNFNLPAIKVNDAIDEIVLNIVEDNPRHK